MCKRLILIDDPQVNGVSLQDSRSSPGPWPPSAVSAHANTVAVAEFFKCHAITILITGRPFSINCVVPSGSSKMVQQLLERRQMVYGQRRVDGGVLFRWISRRVGHEMFHG
jgi:hypothetical protein